MATEDHRSPHDATSPPQPPRASRGLRRVGLAAVVVAVFIAVFGILERRGQDAEVRKWTQELAIPTVALAAPDGDESTPGGVEEHPPSAIRRRGDAEQEAARRVVHRHVATANEALLDDREINRDDGRRHGLRRRGSIRGGGRGVWSVHGEKRQARDRGKNDQGFKEGGTSLRRRDGKICWSGCKIAFFLFFFFFFFVWWSRHDG